ncbi:MAG: hypothetical protein KC502_16545 [Myxococcales bacterium]|nr:hypothetical protein [Myxococcales bacterium]
MRVARTILPSLCALLCVALVAPSIALAAEKKSWIPDLPPPAEYGPRDLAPIKERLPKHKVGTPFARLSLGLQYDSKSLSAESWQMPGVGASFDPVGLKEISSPSSLSLSLGAFVLHGRVELHTTIPLVAFDTKLNNDRDISISYLDLGARIYPWALKPGAIRGFAAIGVARRTVSFTAVEDAGSDVRSLSTWTVPVGIGAGYLTKFGLLIDVSAQVMFGESGTLFTGVDPLSLDQGQPEALRKTIDVSGMRLSLGVRWQRDLWPQTALKNYSELTATRLAKLNDAHLLSDLTVALGPSFQALSRSGNYFDSRPHLAEAYTTGLLPEIAVGWHHDRYDAEARLSFRYFSGKGEGYASSLETSSALVVVEAFKKFDVGFYGLTPWVGLGVGMDWVSATDDQPTGEKTADGSNFVVSVPFGWDYRVDPSSWWFLRTSFRWLPTVEAEIGSGVNFNHGGLEVNVISFVVKPRQLLFWMRGGKAPPPETMAVGNTSNPPPKAAPAENAPAPVAPAKPDPTPVGLSTDTTATQSK